MRLFGDDSQQYNHSEKYNQNPHKASLSREVIAGAAAYEAAKAYENHVAENGQPDSHAKAKELLAGFAGAFFDREFETRGLDLIDRERAEHAAKEHLHEAYDRYNQDNY